MIFATPSAECLDFDVTIVTPCTHTQRAMKLITHEHACAELDTCSILCTMSNLFISGSDKRLYNSGSESGPSLKLGTKVPKGGTFPTVQ